MLHLIADCRLAAESVDRLVGLIGCWLGWLAGWLGGWQAGGLAGSLAGCLAGGLLAACWLAGLAGWLRWTVWQERSIVITGWLAGRKDRLS